MLPPPEATPPPILKHLISLENNDQKRPKDRLNTGIIYSLRPYEREFHAVPEAED